MLLACSGSSERPLGEDYRRYSNPEGLLNAEARLPARCDDWRDVIESARFISPISGPGACGIAVPLEVVMLGEDQPISLDQPARLDCRFAQVLGAFAEGPLQEIADEHFDEPVVSIGWSGSYACRTRNHQAGARLSQHALGLAFDLQGLRLADGRRLTVESGWDGDSDERAFWRDLWRAACGPFNTVLGPESDRFHQNHLHFDVDETRIGRKPYCR